MQLRRELAWVMIVVVVLYGLWLSALGAITYGYAYKPEAHSLMMFSRYTQPMFIFPCALIAFVPRRWATIPLWLLSISIALFIYLPDFQLEDALDTWAAPFAIQEAKEIAQVMIVPVAMKIAVMMKQSGKRRSDHA
jgi:hypothetical protein